MTEHTARQEARILVDQAEYLAEAMLADMDGAECVSMVRQFCATMAEWQPAIRENLEDPVLLGLHCLAAADLFKQAFIKGYTETDGRLKAEKAIKKALGGFE